MLPLWVRAKLYAEAVASQAVDPTNVEMDAAQTILAKIAQIVHFVWRKAPSSNRTI